MEAHVDWNKHVNKCVGDLSKTLVTSQLIQHANKIGINLRSATQVQKSPHQNAPWRDNSHTRKGSVPIGWTDTTPKQAFVDDKLLWHHSHYHKPSTVSKPLQYSDELGGECQSLDPYSHLFYRNSSRDYQQSKSTKTKGWSTKAQCNQRVQTKQKSEMAPHPHQLDLRYYLNGSNLPLFSRYFVDKDNLKLLKKMARIRRKAAHYGKGLSKYKYWGLSTATHLPAPHDFTEDEHAIVDRIMISKRSGYSKDHYTEDQLNYLKYIFDNKLNEFRTTLDRSNQSWMHLQPPPSPRHLDWIMCTVCQEFREYFDEMQNAKDEQNPWNLQLPDNFPQSVYHNQPPSTSLAKYADGWNKPQTCECRSPRQTPEVDGVFGFAAPTRTCSPQSPSKQKS